MAHKSDPNQLTPDGLLAFPARVELVDISPHLLKILETQPEQLHDLTPEKFELLVCDRLAYFGYDFARVGSHAFQKDGGVDLLAWQRTAVVPLLIAVQAKHTSRKDRSVGPDVVRDLAGTVRQHGLNAGLLVTNTTFTPDARWFASKEPLLVQLRDVQDLRRWLKGEFSSHDDWREMPTGIELCPGVFVELPR